MKSTNRSRSSSEKLCLIYGDLSIKVISDFRTSFCCHPIHPVHPIFFLETKHIHVSRIMLNYSFIKCCYEFSGCPLTIIVSVCELALAEMPQEAWRHHLNWLSSSLQRLTEEEEEGDGSSSTRLE